MGSSVLFTNDPDNTPLHIRHLVVDEESQPVVGRNVTAGSNIIQLCDSCILTSGPNSRTICIELFESENHLYLAYQFFRITLVLRKVSRPS